ncbi:hypothetical protein Z043_103146, partial [Scleropages formosus]
MFAANHPVQIKSEAEEGDEDEDEDVVILERPVDSRDRVPTEAAAHPSGWRTYPEAGGSAPSAFEDDHNAAPSVARAHTPAGDQRTPLQEDSYPADHRAHLEKEVLVATAPEPVGPVDAGHEIVVGTQHSADGGVDAAAAPSQEQPLQQSAPPPPPPLLPLTPDAVEAVVEQRAPQEPPPAQPLEV